MNILESQNKEHGFFGTAALHGRREVEAKWNAAFLWVAATVPSWSPENIRDFLDGRPGRHLADELHDCGSLSRISTTRWLRAMYEFAVEIGIADKTPGLDLRLKADAEYQKAVECAKKAEELFGKILDQLPRKEEDTPYSRGLRAYASARIAETRQFLFEE